MYTHELISKICIVNMLCDFNWYCKINSQSTSSGTLHSRFRMKNSKYHPSWIAGLIPKKKVISRHAEIYKNIFLKEKKIVKEN
jgi:hypothetical protein